MNILWRAYIIECKDGTLYTGITNNIEKRINAHNSGAGCKFTRSRNPVKLMYSEECVDKNHALAREWQIKKLSRIEKFALIKSHKS